MQVLESGHLQKASGQISTFSASEILTLLLTQKITIGKNAVFRVKKIHFKNTCKIENYPPSKRGGRKKTHKKNEGRNQGERKIIYLRKNSKNKFT